MTLKFFAKMLCPEVALVIKKNGKMLEAVFAEDVKTSKYAEAIVDDWTMGHGAACTVIIK